MFHLKNPIREKKRTRRRGGRKKGREGQKKQSMNESRICVLQSERRHGNGNHKWLLIAWLDRIPSLNTSALLGSLYSMEISTTNVVCDMWLHRPGTGRVQLDPIDGGSSIFIISPPLALDVNQPETWRPYVGRTIKSILCTVCYIYMRPIVCINRLAIRIVSRSVWYRGISTTAFPTGTSHRTIFSRFDGSWTRTPPPSSCSPKNIIN